MRTGFDGRYPEDAWEAERGTGVDPRTGLLAPREGEYTNFEPFCVRAGDVLVLKAEGPEYRTSFYLPETDPALVYTYCYQPEANWARYCPERSDPDWKKNMTVFDTDGYVRVTVRGTAAPPESLSGLLLLEKGARSREAGEMWPSWIGAEADRVSKRLGKVRREGDAVLFLLADTHYTMGCTWPETVQSLRVMKERVRPSGIIHLGDVTDGMLSEKWTSRFAERVLGDLRSLGVPFDGCLGNHDSNYFRGNAHAMPKDRCAEMYLGRKTPYAYRDLPEVRVRMIFLDTFDQTRDQRYGFSDEEIPWLSRVLKQVPEGYRVLVFSHVPPLARLHVWSDRIRASGPVMQLLADFHAAHGGAVLGWIHGHNHADQVYRGAAFPIVSIGCGKLESFPEHKPEGATTFERIAGHPSQELWDVLVLHRETRDFDLIRYGAGTDRYIG